MQSKGPDRHEKARGAVLRELIDVLFHENLAGIVDRGAVTTDIEPAGAVSDFTLEGDEQYFRFPSKQSGCALFFRVRPCLFLQPYRLSRPPVIVIPPPPGAPQAVFDPAEVLRFLATHLLDREERDRMPNVQEVIRDLERAVAQTALSFEAAGPLLDALSSSRRPSLLLWESVAALRDRPFHPVSRAKVGWNEEEYRRFAPEFNASFGLDWIAVRRDHLQCSAAAAETEIAPLVLNGKEQERLAASLAEARRDGSDYLALPVHPWQGSRLLPKEYAVEFRRGICLPLARGLGRFVATSSVRTLSPAGGGGVHLKLPLGIASLGALRLLPPHFLYNGERAYQLLERLLAIEPLLARQLHLCVEERWWAFSAAGGDKSGHLAALLRFIPADLVKDPSTALIPMSALSVVAPGGRIPAVDYLFRERFEEDGAAPDQGLALFQEVCERITEPALLCFRYGMMPEMHGQNVLLVVRKGRVVGLLLRDYDTLRIYPPWMAEAGLPGPDYIVKPNSTLINQTPEELLAYFQTLCIQVNLYAIAAALSHRYGIKEDLFWRVIHACIEKTLSAFDFPLPVRSVLTRGLLQSERWPTKQVLTPLLARSGPAGPGMPGGRGETANPLRALRPLVNPIHPCEVPS